MVWSICEAARARRLRVFLIGGDPGVARHAAEVFRRTYPGLEIVGTACPHVGFEDNGDELERLIHQVASTKPRVVLVALGFPKQDVLIQTLREALPHASFLGVGISLSYVTGELSRPPDWLCRLGFEWAFRLLQEPSRRLVRRYLVNGLPFALRLLTAAIAVRANRDRYKDSWGRANNDA